ncbi:MAG: DUF2953 domain-containing protein [Eubacterium sp.]|nr:DUF2953 domain-containing protein [Eubacterium sp.]
MILAVLKVIGIFLLVVLGLVLFFLLSALFVPVCYRMWGKRTVDVLEGKASVSWLFGLMRLSVGYIDSQSKLELYLFGIPLLALKDRIDRRRKNRRKSVKRMRQRKTEKKAVQQKRESSQAVPSVTGKSSYTKPADQICKDNQVKEPVEKPVQNQVDSNSTEQEPDTAAVIFQKIKEILLKIWRFPGRVLERIRKSRLTFRQFCDKIKKWYRFLQMDDTKQALLFLKGKGFLVLRHMLPVKIQGNLHFGFEDPSITGQVLAVAGMVYPLYGKTFRIIPDFKQQILEGEVNLKGRVFGGYLLLQAWQIYRCKEIRRTYQRFQHKEA